MLPLDGADTPASRIFRINSAGTGSGFSRRIDRVVAIISNRFAVSSGMIPSRPSVRLHIPGYTKARAELGHVQVGLSAGSPQGSASHQFPLRRTPVPGWPPLVLSQRRTGRKIVLCPP